MRVITGTARGKRLETPVGEDVRPTTDMVKEAIFSAIQFDIEGRRVLDLFAGSGQLGIEALSRGAESAVFVDLSEASLKIVRNNLEITGFTDRSRVIKSDYAVFSGSARDTFDIAFLDPPYKSGVLKNALEKTASLMSEYGIIVCEHPPEYALPDAVLDFRVYRSYRYGKIRVTIYRRGLSDV